MILRVQQGLAAEGFEVSVSKLCRWFGVPRRTVYYRPVKSAPKVDSKYVEPIKAMIEESPSFGYRTVAWLLGFNKNTVQRVIRTLKEQCAHRHRFETLQHASRVIGDWIRFYNHQRPHQALKMKTPAQAYALAA